MHDSITTGTHPPRCPFCEVYELEPSGPDSARCSSCGGFLCGELVKTLRQITELPDAIGRHPCEECSHPEMRRLPDGVFHCPACGSEVTPVSRSSS
jgi:ribosomal protein L37AE/L43A